MVTTEAGVSGTPALKKSQEHPPKFGEAIVKSWLDGSVKGVEDVKDKVKKGPVSRPKAAPPAAWTKPGKVKASATLKPPSGKAKSSAGPNHPKPSL